MQFADSTHALTSATRREFLRLGGLVLGASVLPGVAADPALDAALPTTDKSIVFLFMHGGPAQTETFDPKMDRPSEFRSVTGEVKTSLPGVTFGATFERLARLAHKMAVVRSFVPGSGNHDIKPVVDRHSMQANLSALYARIAGATAPTGLPSTAMLFPRAVEPESQPGNMTFGKFLSTGKVGRQYAPFAPDLDGDLQADLKLHLAPHRFEDRKSLLHKLDALRHRVETDRRLAGVDRIQQQAFDTLTEGISWAFDLSAEDPKLVERYDTSKLMTAKQISRRWNNHGNYVDHVASLGKLMLLARRLCEFGCRYVTVTTNFVWDMHADKNNATMEEGMRYVGRPFDRAVSAFLDDVETRGLSDKILLVCCGEMGRSAKINAKGGRDHWGKLGPLMLAGGGLHMGQVIGESDENGGEPREDPVTIPDLQATIMHTLLDVGQVRLMDDLPVDLKRWIGEGKPIPQLMHS